MDKVVIVGSGIAGLSAAESIKENSPKTPVLIIGKEDYAPYIRMKLSKALADNVDVESIYLKSTSWFGENEIGLIKGCTATNINLEDKVVETSNGLKIDYTKLIIANGSSPFVPPIKNASLKGVFTVREFKDVENIRSYIKENKVKNISVIGGGLLGIESAWSLISSGLDLNVSIIQNSNRILSRQVDKEGSDILEKVMSDNSITVYKDADTSELIGEYKVQGIKIEDGRVIDTDLVIISAGVRSNKQIAEKCGIESGRGIKVNEYMETSVSDVYSAGDAAEYNGKVLGLWPIAYEQGKIAGLSSIGLKVPYKEVSPSSMLMVMDTSVFSIGDINSGDALEVKYNEGTYTKLFFRDEVIVGAVLINSNEKAAIIKNAIDEKRSFKKELDLNENIYSIL